MALVVVSVLVVAHPGAASAGRPMGMLWFNAGDGTLKQWRISADGSGSVYGWFIWGGFSCSAASGCAGLWDLLGVDDFDRDGYQDLLMYRDDTGVLYQRLRGPNNTMKATVALTWTCDTSCANRWRPVGIADMDLNGYPDVVWWNSRDGIISSWLLGPDGIVLGRLDVDRPCGWSEDCSTIWQPIDLTDMNGDGWQDLVWYDRRAGWVKTWLIYGGDRAHTVQYLDWRCSNVGGALACSNFWKPVAAADINGDGFGDITWHNIGSGVVSNWITNGHGNVVYRHDLTGEKCGSADGCVDKWVPVDIFVA